MYNSGVSALCRSISAMIGIPDAVTLELQSPFLAQPCAQQVTFDLSSCTPSWSEEIDFSFIVAKVREGRRKEAAELPAFLEGSMLNFGTRKMLV